MCSSDLSKDSACMVYKLCERKVYIKNNKLSYVISTPLVNKGEFRVYRLVPVLVPSQQRQTNIYTGCPGGKDLTSGECSLGQTIPI